MRGSVRRRGEKGTPWEYRLEFGPQPAQRCPACTAARARVARWWLEGRPLAECPQCGGALEDVHERRQSSVSGFGKKGDAQKALADAMRAFSDGAYVEPTRVTLAEYLTREWLPGIETTLRPSTARMYRMHVESYIVPKIGAVPLQKLSPATIGMLYRDLLDDGAVKRPKATTTNTEDGQAVNGREPAKKGLSPTTVRHTHAVLHHALKDAARRQRIARNPADAVAAPKKSSADHAEMKTWTSDEVGAFLRATGDDRLGPLWHVAAMTGMRRGELCGLRWGDVRLDTDKPSLSVCRSIVAAGSATRVQEPKTRRGRRSVALDPGTAAALRRQAAQQASDAAAVGALWETTDYVFTTKTGQPLHPDTITKAFERAATSAMLPRIRFHDLRHTHATLCLQAGIHPKVVSERLGHSTVSMTLDVYSHSIPAMQESAADLIAALVDSGQ